LAYVGQSAVFGNYVLLGRLNRGGMAEVFLARSLRPGEGDVLLAMKRTLPQFARDRDFVSMFKDEATVASGLEHPNICRIYDHGQVADQLFIVMEFIHGKDLKVVQARCRERQEAIPFRYSAFILARTAQALDRAHNKTNEAGEPQNIVHRDVSPQNILISYDGVPKLIDFGIAKAKGRIAETQVGVIKGKFAYMSPEQALGKPIDRRTDVFALGVVLYELVTGRHAFKGGSDFSTLQHITQAQYRPPAELNKSIPGPLVAIINKALARDAADRYQTAAAMAVDLDAFLATDAHAPNTGVLSAFMRKLFRDDYVREAARIKGYLETKLSASPAGPERAVPSPQPEEREAASPAVGKPDEEALTDAIGISPSIIRSEDGKELPNISGAHESFATRSGAHERPAPRTTTTQSRPSGLHAATLRARNEEDASPTQVAPMSKELLASRVSQSAAAAKPVEEAPRSPSGTVILPAAAEVAVPNAIANHAERTVVDVRLGGAAALAVEHTEHEEAERPRWPAPDPELMSAASKTAPLKPDEIRFVGAAKPADSGSHRKEAGSGSGERPANRSATHSAARAAVKASSRSQSGRHLAEKPKRRRMLTTSELIVLLGVAFFGIVTVVAVYLVLRHGAEPAKTTTVESVPVTPQPIDNR
jgi:serine/threonine protein kinase